nr:flavin carrier protein 1 [Quercus suber]
MFGGDVVTGNRDVLDRRRGVQAVQTPLIGWPRRRLGHCSPVTATQHLITTDRLPSPPPPPPPPPPLSGLFHNPFLTVFRFHSPLHLWQLTCSWSDAHHHPPPLRAAIPPSLVLATPGRRIPAAAQTLLAFLPRSAPSPTIRTPNAIPTSIPAYAHNHTAMKPSLLWRAWAPLLALASYASAERMLLSDSLTNCQAQNNFSATSFDVTLTPNNNSLSIAINGVSTINGYVTIDLLVFAYGLQAYQTTINPCSKDPNNPFSNFCPMTEGPITLPPSNLPIDADSLARVPGIAYSVPDLDAKVQVFFNMTSTGKPAACVETELSNGKTVDQKGVAWALAVVSGLALVASAITSGLGHSNTAAHVAANALALFGYFQAQAFVGMTAVSLPPIVSSWTQNFQWSMGIIRVGFIQNICVWYQRATGGTPSQLLFSLATTSVQVEKRELKRAALMMKRGIVNALTPRADTSTTATAGTAVVVRGIERVGFRAHIEKTNIFLTGYIFFLIFVVFTVLGVLIFKGVCELLARSGHMNGDKFQDFRNGWTTVTKGILFRIVLIGFPQMIVLCFWEFTKDDSGAEMVLAIFTIFTMIGILAWASSKVIRLARRSIAMHKNPAYILYSDPSALNKWGFLYVQFKATAYFFVVPVLIYLLIKGMFIAFAQANGTLQAIALVIIDALFLIAICVMRPYMDKKTNAFNISICAINFLNAIFLLVFTGIFNQPGIVTGVMGVVFFVYNAIFSLVLIIIVIVASVIAVVAKNPETRYQPMRDDRGSFIKSQSQLTTELDALGATARGDTKHDWHSKPGARIEEDEEDSWSGSSDHNAYNQQQTAYGGRGMNEPPRSPINNSAPGFPSETGSGRHMPPTHNDSTSGSMTSSTHRFRAQNASPSPWQRGAGYELGGPIGWNWILHSSPHVAMRSRRCRYLHSGATKHDWHSKPGARIEEDEEDSWSGSSDHNAYNQQQTAYGGRGMNEPPRSPINNSAPGFPSETGSGRHMPPTHNDSTSGSMTSSTHRFRAQNASPSPWQRGAGYE